MAPSARLIAIFRCFPETDIAPTP
jgi:predicted P-loop ATPase